MAASEIRRVTGDYRRMAVAGRGVEAGKNAAHALNGITVGKRSISDCFSGTALIVTPLEPATIDQDGLNSGDDRRL
jgi:hypothetical protein